MARLAGKKFAAGLSERPEWDDDPLPARAGKDTEADDKAELESVRRELARADQRSRDVSGERHHFSVVALNQEQRDAILAALGDCVITAEGGRYVDGIALAKRLGIALPESKPTAIRPTKPRKRAAAHPVIPDYPT